MPHPLEHSGVRPEVLLWNIVAISNGFGVAVIEKKTPI
jgi:hypothetical protein